MLKIFPEMTGDIVMAPQLIPKPEDPKASATSAGNTPNSAPYPRPLRLESRYKWVGFSVVRPEICARVKMSEDATSDQYRDEWRRLTTKSEPIPEASLPVNEPMDKMATCIS